MSIFISTKSTVREAETDVIAHTHTHTPHTHTYADERIGACHVMWCDVMWCDMMSCDAGV